MPTHSEPALERVRRLALALDGASEKQAWGRPTFRVAGRMFAGYVDDHHGDGRRTLWCAAPAGSQVALCSSQPDTFFVPPYVGTRGWIGVVLARVNDARLSKLLLDAHVAVRPTKAKSDATKRTRAAPTRRKASRSPRRGGP